MVTMVTIDVVRLMLVRVASADQPMAVRAVMVLNVETWYAEGNECTWPEADKAKEDAQEPGDTGEVRLDFCMAEVLAVRAQCIN